MRYGWNHFLPWFFQILMVLFGVVNIPKFALAHRDDYLDETLVYLTLERNEFEPEYWCDWGHFSNPNLHFIRHNFAVEYGISNHWMIDGRASIVRERGSNRFQSGRFESRYRFSNEGILPLDIAVSGEINTARARDGSQEYGIEPRLIVSKDFGKANITLNLSEEISLDSTSAEFNVATGFRYNASKFLRLGSEIKYNFDNRSGSLIPQIWFDFPQEVTIKLGGSFGVDLKQEDFGRIAIEKGF